MCTYLHRNRPVTAVTVMPLCEEKFSRLRRVDTHGDPAAVAEALHQLGPSGEGAVQGAGGAQLQCLGVLPQQPAEQEASNY